MVFLTRIEHFNAAHKLYNPSWTREKNEEIFGALGPYVNKVVERAYTVTDEDITGLREAGYTEDQIFEATVSAALGAGLVRLNSGIGALRASEQCKQGPTR